MKTRVAVLGTLAEFHQEAIPYDMKALVALVKRIRPDLLCLDMAPEQWRAQDFSTLPPEYREGLLPLAQLGDIVIVPVGDRPLSSATAPTSPPGGTVKLLRSGLAVIQRTASGPDAVNQGWRHECANWLYALLELFGRADGQQRQAHVAHLVQRVLEVVRRDPHARILVVVNVQYCHRIRPVLRAQPEVEMMHYQAL